MIRLHFNLKVISRLYLFATDSSSFLCGFCSVWTYKLICSVMSTEIDRYFLLTFVPSVINRNIKVPKAVDHSRASMFIWLCMWSASLRNSRHKNANKSKVVMNAAETITSTDRCGPSRLRYDLTQSHALIFRTLFNLKWGMEDFLARRDDVRWEKSFAKRNL